MNVDLHQNKEGIAISDPIVGYYTNLDLSEMERFMCFSSSFVREFVKNIARKQANRISYQIGMFRRGVHICEGGSISASGFGLGFQFCGGSKSAVTPISCAVSLI